MQLAEMGFPLEACRKAVYYTGNMGPEMAFNWIIAHMEEPGEPAARHDAPRMMMMWWSVKLNMSHDLYSQKFRVINMSVLASNYMLGLIFTHKTLNKNNTNAVFP